MYGNTPYNAKAILLSMIKAIFKQGREQFLPFIVTIVAILLTDLLIGVLIGIAYTIYFLIKHTDRAGYTAKEHHEGHTKHFTIELALNVNFLNKRNFANCLKIFLRTRLSR